ncbi:hypothetical protein MRB53_040633 [Persea americana]|nr:hypothetical protein MRB53_040633 [Persea americana]
MWTKPRSNKTQEMPSTFMTNSSPDKQQNSKSINHASAHAAQLHKDVDVEMASGSDSDTGSEDDDDEEPLPGWHSTPSQAVPPSSGVVTTSQSPSRRDTRPSSSGDWKCLFHRPLNSLVIIATHELAIFKVSNAKNGEQTLLFP